MNIRVGERLPEDFEIPIASRPMQPRIPLDALVANQRRGAGIRARFGDDGTRWCAGCNFAFAPSSKASLCPQCDRERDRLRKSRGRAAVQKVAIEVAVLDQLSAHTRELERLVGKILSAKHSGRNPTTRLLDDLTMQTKGIINGMIDVERVVAAARNSGAVRRQGTASNR